MQAPKKQLHTGCDCFGAVEVLCKPDGPTALRRLMATSKKCFRITVPTLMRQAGGMCMFRPNQVQQRRRILLPFELACMCLATESLRL